MASSKYRKYIRSDAWKAKRVLVLSQVECCEGCERDDVPLQVHHLTYDRLYREVLSDLMALCDRCHKEAELGVKEGALRRSGDGLREETIYYLRREIGHAYKTVAIQVPRKPVKRHYRSGPVSSFEAYIRRLNQSLTQ